MKNAIMSLMVMLIFVVSIVPAGAANYGSLSEENVVASSVSTTSIGSTEDDVRTTKIGKEFKLKTGETVRIQSYTNMEITLVGVQAVEVCTLEINNDCSKIYNTAKIKIATTQSDPREPVPIVVELKAGEAAAAFNAEIKVTKIIGNVVYLFVSASVPIGDGPDDNPVKIGKEFKLQEGETATVKDYKNMKITLTDIVIAVCTTETVMECSRYNKAQLQVITGRDYVTPESVSAAPMIMELNAGESKSFLDATITLNKLTAEVAYLTVTTGGTTWEFATLSINPESQTVKLGDGVTYKVTLQDRHPIEPYPCPEGIGVVCTPSFTPRIYLYNIKVTNLPFAKDFPKEVEVSSGESKTFNLEVKPYSAAGEKEESEEAVGVSITTEDTNAGTTSSTSVITYANSDVAMPYNVRNPRAYKFSVSAVLDGNRIASDTAFLTVEPETPPNPPPFPSEKISIRLQKGWNLISLPGKLVSFEADGIAQKLLSFVYLKDQQKYVTLQEAQKILGKDFKAYLARNAFWVYSYSEYDLEAKIDARVSLDNIKLNTGWNLVPITEDMVGGYLSDLKGDCSFEKLYMWSASAQSWKSVGENYAFNSNQVGGGIIIKAADSCTLAGATVTAIAPPAMPE